MGDVVEEIERAIVLRVLSVAAIPTPDDLAPSLGPQVTPYQRPIYSPAAQYPPSGRGSLAEHGADCRQFRKGDGQDGRASLKPLEQTSEAPIHFYAPKMDRKSHRVIIGRL